MKLINSVKLVPFAIAVFVAVVSAGCGPVDDELPTQPPQEPNPQQPVDPTM